MPSSRARAVGLGAAIWAGLAASLLGSPARGQQAVQGFAVERSYPSAPGGGWFVMDDLSFGGGLGGAAEWTTGYAKDPLRVTDGVTHVAVVSDEAFTDVGFAATYDRFRLYLNLTAPLAIEGDQPKTAVGGYSFVGPSLDLGSHPDTLSDPRVGLDTRLYGGPNDPVRLGVGTQLYVPSGNRSDYDTDGTYRVMVRALFAGDVGMLSYAAQVGAHFRPRDDTPAPGSPKGSELLFGAAAGMRFPLHGAPNASLIVGPEVFGASAVRYLFSSSATECEGLFSGRYQVPLAHGQFRVKLGVGAGLDPRFGAPEWRTVFAVELSGRGGVEGRPLQ
jgi:hypothetical protein